MRVVALDCDGVLCDPYTAALTIARDLHGAPDMTARDIHCFDFLSYGMGIESNDEFWAQVWTSPLIQKMPWADETVAKLKELGFRVVLVTHRPSLVGAEHARRFGESIGAHDVVAVQKTSEKIDVVMSLAAVAALEDHPVTAAKLGEVLGYSFLLTKPWNWFCIDVRSRWRRVPSLAHFTGEMENIAKELGI